jgi:hypothetical protein
MPEFDFVELLVLCRPTEKLSRSAEWAEPPFWTSIPTKSKSRDTTSAEGAVGSSEGWADSRHTHQLADLCPIR